MESQKRINAYGFQIGEMKKGTLNKITDVPGITVGHFTIDNEQNKTGVTVILPCSENIFLHKRAAASCILNGYGKTTGLMQIDELGVVESPIVLTNTLNVGLVHDAIVEYMISECNKLGVHITSFNPIIGECNDSYLNDIQNRVVKKEHVFQAIESASKDFLEGDIGAGKGMSCHQLKGGIGSASRMIELDGKLHTLGVLVLSNYGALHDLTIQGRPIGRELENKVDVHEKVDKGSIIIVMGTDAPLSERQIKRVCKRASLGLARTGSTLGNGSGDVVIGFTTATIINSQENREILPVQIIREDKIDLFFRAIAEVTEESVLNSMITAERVVGYSGNVRESLKNLLNYENKRATG